MMLPFALRPTGDVIVWQRQKPPATLTNGYHTTLVESGTAALALALIAARHKHRHEKPQVILPAYGCPDLIAAALFAKVQPVLVDIETQSPNYQLSALRAAIGDQCIGIVCASFLGIRADESAIRSAIGARDIMLIEDSAQWFPRNHTQTFFGDAVVVSFGRGKPVNLLGGGALLTRQPLSQDVRIAIQAASDGMSLQLRDALKIAAYNLLITPAVYGIVARLPFLALGQTIFHALNDISAMPDHKQALIAANIANYQQRPLMTTQWRNALKQLNDPGIIDLGATHHLADDCAMLRYPLLILDTDRRNRVYQRLNAAGLGASIMYPQALMDIPGVAQHALLHDSQENATQFSRTLLTLPTHAAASNAVREKTLDILRTTP